jgi:hypothetical protein
MTEACPGLVADRPTAIPEAWQSSAFHLAALNSDQVRLTFVGHATFLIESPELVRIATDYNDYVKPPVLPDIVTMNHAHDTHYTDHPDPAIKYVLRGWGTSPEQPAIWDLKYRDVRVRNVPTNIRSFYGSAMTERYGNSIFIFEIANLCIAHLGHLHHTLTQQQLNEIGRIDVVMAPVDGSYTLDLDGMMEVLTAPKATFWTGFSIAQASSGMSKRWKFLQSWFRKRLCPRHPRSWCCRDIDEIRSDVDAGG